MLTDFRNFFIVEFIKKFAANWLWHCPPNLKCVATLPCEMTVVTNRHFHIKTIYSTWLVTNKMSDCKFMTKFKCKLQRLFEMSTFRTDTGTKKRKGKEKEHCIRRTVNICQSYGQKYRGPFLTDSVDLSLGRLPDRSWRRCPGRPRNSWLDQLRRDNSTLHLLLTSGDEPSRVDTRGWRYGPRRLRVNDDDDE